mmetsp:Transcript_30047/g.55451  ORF Transcript_30047/g.55451 Transcript_30047/m.55451 type:complete len:232 (-) Transcript_30047:109-804(-)
MQMADSVERKEIIYSLVTRGPNVVLAEYTALAGNFQQATVQFLHKIQPTEEWKSYIYGDQAFHYIMDHSIIEGGVWFVCMADRAMERRRPLAFLQALQETFRNQFSTDEVATASAWGLQKDFGDKIRLYMEKFNSPESDKITSMMAKVQHINDNLVESIDKILERQDKIELLVNRSQLLSESSSSFSREAQRLRRVVWWRNTRKLAIFAVVGILAILIILFASCGIRFERC